jgi:putative transposase
MTIDNELIDNLLKDYKKPGDISGENGLLKQLMKQLLERRWRRSWIGRTLVSMR